MTAAIITGLRVKKETIGEITGAARVMRELATPVPARGARAPGRHRRHRRRRRLAASTSPPPRCSWPRRRARKVAKHGGRSVSSKSGSADVLEALGAHIDLTPKQVAECMDADRHRLHVRAQPPSGDEGGGAGAQGNGRAHAVQHPRAADQPGRRAEHPDGRVPSRTWSASRCACCERLGAEQRDGGVRAATAWTRSRWARPRWWASCATAQIREYEIEPEDFGLAMASSRNLRVEDADASMAHAAAGSAGGQAGRGARHRLPQRRRGAVRGRRARRHRRGHRAGAQGDREQATRWPRWRSSSPRRGVSQAARVAPLALCTVKLSPDRPACSDCAHVRHPATHPARKTEEIAERERGAAAGRALAARCADLPRTRGFAAAIEASIDAGRPAVIAEVKKASPSKGVIRDDFQPADIARSYAGGRRGLPVGADRPGLLPGQRGVPAAGARAACSLPVLRKDFIVDPYQVYETAGDRRRLHPADRRGAGRRAPAGTVAAGRGAGHGRAGAKCTTWRNWIARWRCRRH